jgi:hypothetical protein
MVLCAGATGSAAGACRLDSPAHRVTVVELFTSEGCSSCPPADRWFSGLAKEGITAANAVLLAYHVDYWNQLGWPDRFSRPQFSDRQRAVAQRSGTGFIYTPQVTVDGRDFRQRLSTGSLRAKLAGINREQGQARIKADIRRSASELHISAEVGLADAGSPNAKVWIAAFENGLATHVKAGENAGARLNHDYVVRELAGPFPIEAGGRARLDHRIKVAADWNPERLGIAIFVERSDTGEVLGAAAQYPLCAA